MLRVKTEHLIKLILHNGQVTFWFLCYLQANTDFLYPLSGNTKRLILRENGTAKSNFNP